MFITLYCLNLQISKIEKQATSTIFQSTMNNVVFAWKPIRMLTLSNLFTLENRKKLSTLPTFVYYGKTRMAEF